MVSNITLSSVFHMLIYIFLTFYHSNDICGIVISYPFTFLTFLPVQTKTPIQRHLSRLHFNKCGHVFAFKDENSCGFYFLILSTFYFLLASEQIPALIASLIPVQVFSPYSGWDFLFHSRFGLYLPA